MTTLFERLQEDYKNALRNRETFKKETLSTFISSVQTYEKAGKEVREINDGVVLQLLTGRVNEYHKTIEQLKEVGRDFSQQEEAKNLLQEYLPKQLSQEELETILKDMYFSQEKRGKNVIGVLMGGLKKQYPSQYDPALAKSIVDSLILIELL